MNDMRIGEFIAERLNIPKAELNRFLNMQGYLDDKIGEIALREKFVTPDGLDRILDFHKKNKVTFGNSAICVGLMKNSHVKYLLDIQAREKHRLGELLVRRNIITEKKFLRLLDAFYSQKNIRFTILSLMRDALSKEVQKAVEPYHYVFRALKDKKELADALKEINPQLIFLDEETGGAPEFAKEIREDPAAPDRLKIALLSDKTEKMEILSGYEYGIDYFLPIPFNAKHLINIIIDTEIKGVRNLKKRVLVVDDSATVRASIAEELEENGFQTACAQNGKEALEMATLERPDLITMDINMPVMDGYEACLNLKKNPETSHIPIIILTTNDSKEEREKGFEVGATEYFIKPFPKGHLSSYIGHILLEGKLNRSEKILVAEDSPITKNIYESIFNKQGFSYEIVDDGKDVLHLLKQGYDPSCIILDVFMPGMDGFETCKKLKSTEKYRHIPVLMVTGSGDRENILKGLRSGAEDYIIKPFDEDELMARVEAHIKFFELYKKLQKQYKLATEKGTELEKAKQRAEEANKLKDKFVSLVAHDLRSPFTTILGFLNLILEDDKKKLDEEHRELMEMVVDRGKDMLDMIRQLLDVGRFRSGRIEPKSAFEDAHYLVRKALAGLEMLANKKGLRLLNKVPTHTRLYVDTNLFTQVIQNLVSNAIKFSKEGDTITVYAPEGEGGAIAVKDTGQGIEKKRLNNLFKYEEDTSTPGTDGERGSGLGLPLCRDIMDAHEGTLSVESTPGRGSVFLAKLPDVRPRILVVDDSRIIRVNIVKALKPLDVDVIEAENGVEALDLLKSGDIHLIITDIIMPEMDGFELIRRVKKNPNTRAIPMLVITSDKNIETREKVFQFGADDFAQKPITEEDFIPRVYKYVI